MADRQSDLKRLSLDKIIEAMTADLEGSPGHYAQFGGGSSGSSAMPGWGEYPRSQVQHYLQHNGAPMAPYLPQEMPNYEPPQAEPIYYSSQPVNHLEINERNDLIGTIDVGNGNYINVIYGNASQIMMEQCPYNNPNLLEREYGLFGNKQPQQPQLAQPQNGTNGKQLIENLVGNWAPNQSGTYSPFGGSSPDPQSAPKEVQHKVEQQQQQQKKPRMVAEVKPMRPSYSDVLTKCVAAPMTPVPSAVKPKPDLAKKVLSKNSGKGGKAKTAALKRQNSSGSDEHNSPKIQAPKKIPDKKSNLTGRRWVSLDNLGIDNSSSFDTSFEKKKPLGKPQKKSDGLKAQKNVAAQPKRPQASYVNATTVNNFSQTVATDKVEKVTQGYPKVKKDKSKKLQNEKTLKKGRAGRKRENREAVKNLYKTVTKHTTRWSKLALRVFFWLLHLICDVASMSANLVIQLGKCGWYHTILYTKYSWIYLASAFGKVRFLNALGRQMDRWFGNSRFAFWRKFQSKASDKENANWIHGGLESNIALPSTGEEAMKRLLACKGKDPYSILGVTSTCSDDDIKKYYKRQAVLVHPDKNNQPGAEEAFKILVHAFDIIGEPERRQAFDQTRQVEAAWGELSDLLSQLHRKMEQAANTIRCTNCGLKHKRVPTQRPCYAARFCAQCKIRHSAKEGDIWAESRVMGFLWHYYACMEGAVYDVTEWAACQARNLKHLRANTHSVQYRIVLGQRPPAQTSVGKKKQSDSNASEADFEDFLNNLYNGKPGGTSTNGDQSAFRCDNRRRKTKRKK